MFYFLYKTTNKINGRFYIGKHQTTNLNDGYLGSGVALTKAIKKYGKENFVREVIGFYESADDLITAERETITKEMIADSNCYNAALGGYGGITVLYKEHPLYESTRLKLSESKKNKYKNETKESRSYRLRNFTMKGKRHTDETKQKISKKIKELDRKGERSPRFGTKLSAETKLKLSIAKKGKKLSEERKRKMAEIRPCMAGEHNPMFGKHHSPETKELLRERALSRERKSCFNCGKVASPSNLKRWHNENCREKKASE